MSNAIRFINENILTVVIALVFMPLALNLGKGCLRMILNRFRNYPTFAPGAIYTDCISPSGGFYPTLSCIKNGFFSVVMEEPNGAVFFIENRELDNWTLPILYNPMLKDNAQSQHAVDAYNDMLERIRVHRDKMQASGKPKQDRG